jgi:hypothetical protein
MGIDPTVSETSGFRAIDRYVLKFPKDTSPQADTIDTPTFIGYLPKKLDSTFHVSRPDKKVYKYIEPIYAPKGCKKCGSPMQISVKKKGSINLGTNPTIGYTCRAVGCQDVRAKKHIVKMRAKDILHQKSIVAIQVANVFS